ncbi:transporter substrate-binding domain-containing protein [Desulfobacterales bacterium HSG2]|nr:transporter substrate-binding domain-containing protein [Desulfobacterales bacterium HSG2]
MKTRQIFKVFFILTLCTISLPKFADSQEKIVKVGVYDNAPIVFVDKDGKIRGLSVEILEYIAVKENWELEYVLGSFAECISKLDSCETDLQVYIAFSKERALKYEYNQEMLLSNWGVVYTRPDSGVDLILDLEGKRVTLLKETIHVPAFMEMIRSFDINIKPIEIHEPAEGFSLVKEKKADAVVVNRIFFRMGAANQV